MRMRVLRIAALSLLLAAETALCSTGCARAEAARPSATLRGTPRFGFPPLKVMFTLELHGDDEDALWCPGVGWSFGDGDGSWNEGDCPPREPGERSQRFYHAEHVYKRPSPDEHGFLAWAGAWRAGRQVARDEVRVEVR